ncbi:MAG: hypothetical protein HYZ87_00960, partial [Candidatus Omnitrophica bacterium]|nr:hypothetical protein [Candidatus Omnitrophota bacterium]
YTLIVFKTAAQVRYFLPALPFLALLAGFSLARLLNGDKAVARLGGALFAAVIALHAGIFVYKARDRWEAVLGAETAEHYLIRKERSYSAYRYLNGTPKNSRIFNAATEPRRFYNQNRFMAMDDANLRLFLADEKRSLPEYLREGDFDFIWVSPFSDPQVHDFIRERAYQKAFSYDFEEGGTPFHYRIYKRP